MEHIWAHCCLNSWSYLKIVYRNFFYLNERPHLGARDVVTVIYSNYVYRTPKIQRKIRSLNWRLRFVYLFSLFDFFNFVFMNIFLAANLYIMLTYLSHDLAFTQKPSILQKIFRQTNIQFTAIVFKNLSPINYSFHYFYCSLCEMHAISWKKSASRMLINLLKITPIQDCGTWTVCVIKRARSFSLALCSNAILATCC